MRKTINRHAVHEINNGKNLPFNPDEYSRFKYGDIKIARNYGCELANYFAKAILPQIRSKEVIVYSSPYTYIPTASLHLTNCFIDRIKELTIGFNFKPGKIHRIQTYTEDYGSMNASQRYALIKNDTYRIDEPPKFNEHLIFIDDVSITGTHQRVIERLLSKNQIKNEANFLYFSILNDPTVEPDFENYLNYFKVKTMDDLTNLILNSEYSITTRAIKYLLASDEIEFLSFIEAINTSVKKDLLHTIYWASVKNGYNKIPLYCGNLNRLLELLNIADKSSNTVVK
jgi:hypothetical protein